MYQQNIPDKVVCLSLNMAQYQSQGVWVYASHKILGDILPNPPEIREISRNDTTRTDLVTLLPLPEFCFVKGNLVTACECKMFWGWRVVAYIHVNRGMCCLRFMPSIHIVINTLNILIARVKFGFREDKVLVIYHIHFANLTVWKLQFVCSSCTFNFKCKKKRCNEYKRE